MAWASEPAGTSTSDAYRNVVLTGFMGTGKSTVGKVLAELLGFDYLSTDALIESRHGPIERIFSERGETGFRRLERCLAAELADETGKVISTGGGLMLDERNVEVLREGNRVFCLCADLEVVLDRIEKQGRQRPMLQGPNLRARIQRLLAERAPKYDVFDQVAVDRRTPLQVAREIQRRLRTHDEIRLD